MQRSALIREELEDAVAGMSPAARTVFEEIEIRDENTEPEFPEDFDALTPIERISVTKAAEHLKGLSIYMKPGAFTSSRRELCPTRAAKKNAAPVKTTAPHP